jgi:hypothetical protein
MKDRSAGQFIGNVQNILDYLLVTYGKISPSQLNEFDTEVSRKCTMTPSLQWITYSIKSKIYLNMAIWPPAYSALQKIWINFKIHFRQAHAELKERGDLTMEATGYGQGQANMIDEIVTGMTAEFNHQANLAFRPPPLEPPVPPLAPPASAAHATMDTILQQVLAQNQELMKMLASKTTNSASNNTRRPRSNVSSSKRGGQPTYPIPAWATEYHWTHGKCSHKSSKCRNPAPGHQEDATLETKKDGSMFGCT